jgi:hypothetical protein
MDTNNRGIINRFLRLLFFIPACFPLLLNGQGLYKGIVPPEFGGDGLGSAINIVTIDSEEAYYDISYSVGSYGAHEGGVLYKHYSPTLKW